MKFINLKTHNINQIIKTTTKNLLAFNTFEFNSLCLSAYSDKNMIIEIYFYPVSRYLDTIGYANNKRVEVYKPDKVLTYRIRLEPNIYKYRVLPILGECCDFRVLEVANNNSVVAVGTSTNPKLYLKTGLSITSDTRTNDLDGIPITF